MAVNDLNIDQTIDKDYILLTIKDLSPGQTYPVQFRWKHADGTFGSWSPARTITPPSESSPGTPNVTVSGATPGMITVSWDGKDTAGNSLNVKEVDVYFSGSPFNSSVPAVVLTKASTVQQTAPSGQYGVTAYAITARGAASVPKTISGGVTVTAAGPVIEAPTNPNGFTSRRILAGVEVSWAGTYANGEFSGFEAIKIYAGSASALTPGTYTEVGVLTGNKVKNTIVVPVDGTYVKYGQATYIHAAAVNQNGTVGTIQANVTSQSLGPGKATDADINDGAIVIDKLASNVLTVGNLAAGDINATSYVRAGTASAARVEISSSTVGSVLPGLTIYGSDGTTQLLRAPLTGGLTIDADGKFTGNLEVGSGDSVFKSDSDGIYLGSSTWAGASNTFRVSRTGYLTASYGEIGGITIGSSSIGSTTFNLSSSGLQLGNPAQLATTKYSNILVSASGIAHRGGTYNGSTISGTTNSERFTFDATTGYIKITAGADPATGARVIFDNDGIRAYNASNVKTIDINGGGSAVFAGDITTSGGSIAGWTINTSSISSSTGTIINSNGTIKIGVTGDSALYMGAGSDIRMDADTGASSYIKFYTKDATNWTSAIAQIQAGDFRVYSNYLNSVFPIIGAATSIADFVSVASLNNAADNETLKISRNFDTAAKLTTDLTTATQFVQFYKRRSDGTNTVGVGRIVSTSATSTPTFQAGSDERLKKNIETFNDTSFIEDIKSISVYKFHDSLAQDTDRKTIGFLAKEFYPKYPDIVDGVPDAVDEDGDPIYMSISRENLIPHLFNAVKYLSAKVEELEERLGNV